MGMRWESKWERECKWEWDKEAWECERKWE